MKQKEHKTWSVLCAITEERIVLVSAVDESEAKQAARYPSQWVDSMCGAVCDVEVLGEPEVEKS